MTPATNIAAIAIKCRAMLIMVVGLPGHHKINDNQGYQYASQYAANIFNHRL